MEFSNQFEGRISKDLLPNVENLRTELLFDSKISIESVLSEYNYAFKGFHAKLSDEQVKALESDSRVKSVVPNALFFLESAYNKDAIGEPLIAQQTPWGINRVGGIQNGIGKKAWVIDTGIDLDHPDLNVDVSDSYSFISGETADDIIGHGTHVAGTIAAKNNSIGVVGVAAGATVVSIKACNSSGCPVNSIFSAVDYVSLLASSNDVVNMSLGGSDPNNLYTSIDNSVINAANNGIRFSVAAGNERINANDYTPARVQHPNVYTISAFRQGDEFANVFASTVNCNPTGTQGSNYANPPIKYLAPGESILSLWKNGETFTTCGTSMAAPHFAGLLLSGTNKIKIDGFVTDDRDSNADPIAAFSPLSVSISGPGFISSGTYSTWTAVPYSATSSVSYQWYYKNTLTDPWTAAGTNSDTFSWTFYSSPFGSETSFVRVDITSSSEQATASKSVFVEQEDCQVGCIGND